MNNIYLCIKQYKHNENNNIVGVVGNKYLLNRSSKEGRYYYIHDFKTSDYIDWINIVYIDKHFISLTQLRKDKIEKLLKKIRI